MRADKIYGADELTTIRQSSDERGFSAEIVAPRWNPSRLFTVHNPTPRTLRGLHYQTPGAWKLVLCTRGLVFDVAVDLRPKSHTYRRWTSFTLAPGSGVLFAPGVAHGYLTLAPETTLTYLLSGMEGDNQGVRWNDPAIGIEWPELPVVISIKDQMWSDL